MLMAVGRQQDRRLRNDHRDAGRREKRAGAGSQRQEGTRSCEEHEGCGPRSSEVSVLPVSHREPQMSTARGSRGHRRNTGEGHTGQRCPGSTGRGHEGQGRSRSASSGHPDGNPPCPRACAFITGTEDSENPSSPPPGRGCAQTPSGCGKPDSADPHTDVFTPPPHLSLTGSTCGLVAGARTASIPALALGHHEARWGDAATGTKVPGQRGG